jgi:hypothetical protein
MKKKLNTRVLNKESGSIDYGAGQFIVDFEKFNHLKDTIRKTKTLR